MIRKGGVARSIVFAVICLLGIGLGEVAIAVPDQTPAAAPAADLIGWGDGPSASYHDMRQRLERSLTVAEPPDRDRARLALARFHLSHGEAAEAIGYLDRIERRGADHALAVAVALILMERLPEAAAALSDAHLADNPDAALLRAVALGADGDPVLIGGLMARGRHRISLFPPVWQARFQLADADAALRREDVVAAERAIIAARNIGDEVRPAAALRAGKLAWLKGDAIAARASYAEAITAPDPAIAIEADILRTDLAIQMGLESPAAALAALDAHQPELAEWPVPGDVRLILADLRYLSGDVVGALEELRRVIQRAHSDDLVATARSRAMAVVRLRLETATDADRVKAVGLALDFRDLIPATEEGDKVALSLAEAIAAMDLLGPADRLIDHLVETRLNGKARAIAALRLAEIRVARGDGAGAIATLSRWYWPGVLGSGDARAALVRAQAYLLIGDTAAAMSVLPTVPIPGRRRLEADIRWAAAAKEVDVLDKSLWNEAAEVHLRLLDEMVRPDFKITGRSVDERAVLARRVMVAAEAASRHDLLIDLRQRYPFEWARLVDRRPRALSSLSPGPLTLR